MHSFLLSFVVIGVVSCASSEEPATPGQQGSTSGAPSEQPAAESPAVASGPLQGTVGGKPFAAKVALANYGSKTGTATVYPDQ
jgi:hypothetical protein